VSWRKKFTPDPGRQRRIEGESEKSDGMDGTGSWRGCLSVGYNSEELMFLDKLILKVNASERYHW